MNFKKQVIDEMFKCYSTNALTINGEPHLIFAGEGPGIMKIYSGKDFKESHLVWDDSAKLGGTMSIVTVPDFENIFFVSTGFFSMVDSHKSKIFMVTVNGKNVTKKQIAEIDFLHRFGVATVEGKRYLVAATLHGGKVDKPDWSKPGKVLVAELPTDLTAEYTIDLTVILEDLFINHGFSFKSYDDKIAALIGSKSGAFAVYPPQKGEDWKTEKILDFPVSDLCALDLDGDGNDELAVLSPFHGDTFSIYKRVDGKYKEVFTHSKKLDFYHAIWGDTLEGVPSFVIGARKEDMDLFIVQYDHEQSEYVLTMIDTNVGPANVSIYHGPDKDYILSSNRQINQAAIYTVVE